MGGRFSRSTEARKQRRRGKSAEFNNLEREYEHEYYSEEDVNRRQSDQNNLSTFDDLNKQTEQYSMVTLKKSVIPY